MDACLMVLGPARVVMVGGMLMIAVTACGARQLSGPIVMPASPLAEVTTAYRRVLVAGFSTNTVAGVDTNQEASRLFRSELRTEASVQVVEAEPLRVERQALSDVPFWRRVGEEYRKPLIVTGVVDFQSIRAVLRGASGRPQDGSNLSSAIPSVASITAHRRSNR